MREIFNDAEFNCPIFRPTETKFSARFIKVSGARPGAAAPSPPVRTATCTVTPLSEHFSFQCFTYRPTEYCRQGRIQDFCLGVHKFQFQYIFFLLNTRLIRKHLFP